MTHSLCRVLSYLSSSPISSSSSPQLVELHPAYGGQPPDPTRPRRPRRPGGDGPVDGLVLLAEVLVEVAVQHGVGAGVAQAQDVADAVNQGVLEK